MSLTADILGTYLRPRSVYRDLFRKGRREDLALAFAIGFAVLAFVAQTPRLAREAHLEGQDLAALAGATLFATVFVLPLALYAAAALAWAAGRGLTRIRKLAGRGAMRPAQSAEGGTSGGYRSRLALFWALFASTPLLLVHGLVSGLSGQGPIRDIAGLAWLATFLRFWVSGMCAAREPVA